jgi:hypothetical protein
MRNEFRTFFGKTEGKKKFYKHRGNVCEGEEYSHDSGSGTWDMVH